MKITWDESKRLLNVAGHKGLDFADLTADLFAASVIVPAKKGRSMAIGEFRGQAIAVIFVRLGSEGISVISMRPASRKERRVL